MNLECQHYTKRLINLHISVVQSFPHCVGKLNYLFSVLSFPTIMKTAARSTCSCLLHIFAEWLLSIVLGVEMLNPEAHECAVLWLSHTVFYKKGVLICSPSSHVSESLSMYILTNTWVCPTFQILQQTNEQCHIIVHRDEFVSLIVVISVFFSIHVSFSLNILYMPFALLHAGLFQFCLVSSGIFFLL